MLGGKGSAAARAEGAGLRRGENGRESVRACAGARVAVPYCSDPQGGSALEAAVLPNIYPQETVTVARERVVKRCHVVAFHLIFLWCSTWIGFSKSRLVPAAHGLLLTARQLSDPFLSGKEKHALLQQQIEHPLFVILQLQGVEKHCLAVIGPPKQ